MNKKILYIAPSSFPVFGAGNISNIKYLQVLSNAGYEIDLISRRMKWQNYQSDSLESYHLKLNSLNIVEVDNKITFQTCLQYIRAFLKFGVFFKGIHWTIKALPIAIHLAKNNEYDYVVTKVEQSFLIGYYLKKHFGLKWVASWHDPILKSGFPKPYYEHDRDWIERFFLKRIRKMASKADIHTFVSARLKDYMLRDMQVPLNHTRVIPHVVTNIETHQPISSDGLKLIHSGSASSPRNPLPLLMALHHVISKKQDINLHVTFIGVVDKDFEQHIARLKLEQYVDLLKPVSYIETQKLEQNYHVGIVLEADLEEGIFMPSKVSNYVMSGTNIFALSPKIGALNDLYQKGMVTYFAHCTDVHAIEMELMRIYEDFIHNKLPRPINVDADVLPDNILNQFNEL